jgi:hypothetical protein
MLFLLAQLVSPKKSKVWSEFICVITDGNQLMQKNCESTQKVKHAVSKGLLASTHCSW